MKKAAKKQPKPKPYTGPLWKDPTVKTQYPNSKIGPSKNNPNNTIIVNPDGSRTKYGPTVKKSDTMISTSGYSISPIKRPAPKPKPVKDTVTSYTNHGPIGTFDRGKYIEKVKPISQNPNSKVNKAKVKGAKVTTKPKQSTKKK